jgi:hypothetical protein
MRDTQFRALSGVRDLMIGDFEVLPRPEVAPKTILAS